jgi:tetratricopeptide (TPR) repeat protein
MQPRHNFDLVRWTRILAAGALILGFFPLAYPQNPRNEIEVRVALPDGKPADVMPVILLDDGYTEIALHYTDAGGNCYFRGLTQGTFYIQLEPKGNEYLRPAPFRVQIGDVVTSGGEKFKFEMRLLPRDTANSANPSGNAPVIFHQQIPNEAKLEYDRGVESLDKDLVATGEGSLKKAIEVFPTYYDALDRLGSFYVQRKDYTSAQPLLRRAIEVNKQGWHAEYSLGVSLIELKQNKEGIAALKSAGAHNPFSPNIAMRLGLELAKDPASYDDAALALQRASRLAGKELPDTYFFLAKIRTEQKKYGEAADALETYVRVVPKIEPEQKEQYRKAIIQLRSKASRQPEK